MGVALRELIISREASFDEVKNKILSVDAHNQLYQYITTIRGADGTALKDSKNQVTSHLVGLFSRTANLMQKDIRLAYVFDGSPPQLKYAEMNRRSELKRMAERLYDKAVEDENIELMKKYAGRTSRLTKDMVAEAKLLLGALGIPCIQAPSEADAQIAYMVKNKDSYAAVSQDFDALLHGAPLIMRNVSIAGRRKKAKTLSYDIIKPEFVNLNENLKHLGVSQEQLIILGIIVGTDYNPGGVKGIGPKKALKLIHQYQDDFDGLFAELKWNDNFSVSWREIFDIIIKMPVTKDYSLEWGKVDSKKVTELLCEQHDFSRERVLKTLAEIEKSQKNQSQKGLGSFFQ